MTSGPLQQLRMGVLECEPRRWGHIAFPLSQDRPRDSEPLASEGVTEGEASADEPVGQGTRPPLICLSLHPQINSQGFRAGQTASLSPFVVVQ